MAFRSVLAALFVQILSDNVTAGAHIKNNNNNQNRGGGGGSRNIVKVKPDRVVCSHTVWDLVLSQACCRSRQLSSRPSQSHTSCALLDDCFSLVISKYTVPPLQLQVWGAVVI